MAMYGWLVVTGTWLDYNEVHFIYGKFIIPTDELTKSISFQRGRLKAPTRWFCHVLSVIGFGMVFSMASPTGTEKSFIVFWVSMGLSTFTN